MGRMGMGGQRGLGLRQARFGRAWKWFVQTQLPG